MGQKLEPAPVHGDINNPLMKRWLGELHTKVVYRGAILQKDQAQSITSGFNNTKITFDEIGYDTGGIADLSNDRLIVPTDGRRIQLAFSVAWSFAGAGIALTDSMRCVFIDMYDTEGNNIRTSIGGKSGDELDKLLRLQRTPGLAPSNINFHTNNFSQGLIQSVTTGIMDVEPGDYFELICNHNKGSDVDINQVAGNSTSTGHQRATWFSMVVLG
jgi:hypothetical protein